LDGNGNKLHTQKMQVLAITSLAELELIL